MAATGPIHRGMKGNLLPPFPKATVVLLFYSLFLVLQPHQHCSGLTFVSALRDSEITGGLSELRGVPEIEPWLPVCKFLLFFYI